MISTYAKSIYKYTMWQQCYQIYLVMPRSHQFPDSHYHLGAWWKNEAPSAQHVFLVIIFLFVLPPLHFSPLCLLLVWGLHHHYSPPFTLPGMCVDWLFSPAACKCSFLLRASAFFDMMRLQCLIDQVQDGWHIVVIHQLITFWPLHDG